MVTGKRLYWIDAVKACLICLVVLGHLGSVFYPIIYLFHIPAFFFVSGYLCNDQKKTFKGMVRSTIPLISAIFLWNLVYLIVNLFHLACFGSGIMHASEESFFQEALIRPILGIFSVYYPGASYANPLCAQFWFVWILIFLRIICWGIRSYRCSIKLIISAVSIAIIVLIYNYEKPLDSFFYVTRFLASLPFFLMGNVIREKNYVLLWSSKRIYPFFASIFFLLLIMLSHHLQNWGVDIFHFRFGDSVLLFYITAFSGTFFLLTISVHCFSSKNRLIEKISEGTLLILALHMGLVKLLDNCEIINDDPTKFLGLLLILSICVPLIVLCKKRFISLLGKSHL